MAREYFAAPPKEGEMSSIGLLPSDFGEADAVEIWPDNEDAFNLLVAMRGQWRCGPNGPYAFDYGPLDQVRRDMGFPRKRWPGLFADLQVMERAALEQMRKD